jgi:CheY-like chemotaxis protein
MGAKKVMIVDDEADLRTAVRLLLRSHGIDVVEASGGQDALKKLRENPVDLVLIDFLMPGMTGLELAEEIRKDQRLRNLKLAFLTVAIIGQVGRDELDRLGVLDYINKPFDNRDFVQRVKRLLGEK